MSEYTLQEVRKWIDCEFSMTPLQAAEIVDAAIAREAELRAEKERIEAERADLWRQCLDLSGSLDTKSAIIAELKARISELERLLAEREETCDRVSRDLSKQIHHLQTKLEAAGAQGMPDFWLAVQSGGEDDGGVAFGLATKPDDPNGGEVERALVNEYIKDRLVDDDPILCRLAPAWLRHAVPSAPATVVPQTFVKMPPNPTKQELVAAVQRSLENAHKAVSVLGTILSAHKLAGDDVAGEIGGDIQYALRALPVIVAALPAAPAAENAAKESP